MDGSFRWRGGTPGRDGVRLCARDVVGSQFYRQVDLANAPVERFAVLLPEADAENVWILQ